MASGASLLVDKALVGLGEAFRVAKVAAISGRCNCFGDGYVDIYCCDERCASRTRIPVLGSRTELMALKTGLK